MENKSTKEIAKELRDTLKKLNGVKVSVVSDYNHIRVSLMQAPFQAFTDANAKQYASVNQYSYKESESITVDTKVFFQLVDEVIKKHHWDKSDVQSDYFHCAFYYSYNVGQWDKPFVCTAPVFVL
jgi:hypothetical protein